MSLREEKTLSGCLEFYHEQGMEHGIGVLFMPKHEKQIHWLKDGDLLTIFNDSSKKEVIWEDKLIFQDTPFKMPIPKGMNKKEWAEILLTENTANVLPCEYVKEVEEQEAIMQKKQKEHITKNKKQKQLAKHLAIRKFFKNIK